ncbi:MAG: hypothetical protein MZW92_29950 [Comamonadaceae bacterium]|nr:hypothetical protein [Comamonadaceae bacterium]
MFCSPHTTHVTAVVREVLPRTGLAWLDGDDDREWTVTRSTRGAGLDRLTPGAGGTAGRTPRRLAAGRGLHRTAVPSPATGAPRLPPLPLHASGAADGQRERDPRRERHRRRTQARRRPVAAQEHGHRPAQQRRARRPHPQQEEPRQAAAQGRQLALKRRGPAATPATTKTPDACCVGRRAGVRQSQWRSGAGFAGGSPCTSA